MNFLMVNEVMGYKSPLYGRITGSMEVKELPFIPYIMGKWWGNNPLIKAQDDVDILAFDKKSEKALSSLQSMI